MPGHRERKEGKLLTSTEIAVKLPPTTAFPRAPPAVAPPLEPFPIVAEPAALVSLPTTSRSLPSPS